MRIRSRGFSLWGLSVSSLLVVLLCVAPLAGALETGAPHPVIIGTELGYPPYSFLDKNGEAAGYNVDLTRAIAREMHLDVEIRIAPWGQIRLALEAGEIDAIAGMYFSVERDEVVDFTPSYTAIHHAVFVHKGSPEIVLESDLQGLDIIVMQGDIMHDYVLEQGLSVDPVTVGTLADALQLLAEGNHDCALIAELPGLYWLKELSLSGVSMAAPRLNLAHYCFAVTEGNIDLQSSLASGMAIVSGSGEEQEIYDRWLGVLEPRGVPAAKIFKGAALVAIPVLFLLGLFMMRSAMLKNQVASRTRDLQERANELDCLFNISESILGFDTIAKLLQDVAGLIPPGWRYSNLVRARIEFDGREFVSEPFRRTECSQKGDIVIDGEVLGAVEVYFMPEHPLRAEGGQFAADSSLIQTIGRLLSKALQAKMVERRFLAKEIEYRNLFQGMLNGVALHEIICDEEGTPVDYRFLDINPAFEKLTGLTGEKIIGKTVREVIPGVEPIWIQKYGQVALLGETITFEQHSRELGKYFAVSAFQHGQNRFACIFADVTERHQYEKTLADHRSRLQSLASQMANTEDRLRQNIAAGLHDSIGQDLAALKLTVDIMRLNKGTETDGGDPRTRKALSQISKSIDGVVQEIWTLAFQLCPPGLYEAGLMPALEWLVEQFNAQHETQFSLVVIDEPAQLEMEARGLLFQMIRELVSNSVKHAKPKHVSIETVISDDTLQVAVVDDGCGFDAQQELVMTDSAAGFGLFSIRERLAFLAGKLAVESVGGQGTRVTIYFPLRRASHMETEIGNE